MDKQRTAVTRKKGRGERYKKLKKLLYEYCEKHAEGNTMFYGLLREEAETLISICRVDGPKSPKALYNWLHKFIKWCNHLKFYTESNIKKSSQELEMYLINWMLELIASSSVIEHERLKNKAYDYMEKYNVVPYKDRSRWLRRFEDCHNILVKLVDVESQLDKSQSIGDQFDFFGDGILYNWLLEEKKLGKEISFEIFNTETLNLMRKFENNDLINLNKDDKKKKKQFSWLYKIIRRHGLSTKLQPKMSEVKGRDNETNQSNVEEMEKEESSTAESHKSKKLLVDNAQPSCSWQNVDIVSDASTEICPVENITQQNVEIGAFMFSQSIDRFIDSLDPSIIEYVYDIIIRGIEEGNI